MSGSLRVCLCDGGVPAGSGTRSTVDGAQGLGDSGGGTRVLFWCLWPTGLLRADPHYYCCCFLPAAFCVLLVTFRAGKGAGLGTVLCIIMGAVGVDCFSLSLLLLACLCFFG